MKFSFKQIISLVALTSSALVTSAQTYSADESKLYEAAKKEGTVVWYVSAPIEPMKDVATEFEKRYPGIKVEVLRIVGIQQYQRFMQEVQAKRHFVDILHIKFVLPHW